MDKLRQDYQDGINTLKMFMDATDEKMTAPVQVSFLNVRAFVQDVEVKSQRESVFLLYSEKSSTVKFQLLVGNQAQSSGYGGGL